MSRRCTRLLWSAAGQPSPRKRTYPSACVCYWCGDAVSGEACRVRDVCGASFTDHGQAQCSSSQWICPACTWCMTGRPPDTLRLWSIVYRDDRPAVPSHAKAPSLGEYLHLQNKADPSEFDRILCAPPIGRWVCSIADSGQIHVAPFASLNNGAGRWRVRFERNDVVSDPGEYARLADSMQLLYDAGFSKDDIASGSPSPGRLANIGVDLWREQAVLLSPYRGGVLFTLSLFLRRKHD